MKTLFTFLTLSLFSISAIAQSNIDKNDPWASFLTKNEIANALYFVPEPPDTSSITYLNDFSRYQWGKSMRSTERGKQAIFDAYVEADSIFKGFAEAFGILITKEKTPETYFLLQRVANDGSLSVREAKKKYMRKRPYVQFHEPTSVPWDEEELRNSGSYPSGHSARGWAVALVMAELNPTRQNEILKRGLEYGTSRVIVGFHYQSDVDASRISVGGAVASLHANETFLKQLAKAKKELNKILNK